MGAASVAVNPAAVTAARSDSSTRTARTPDATSRGRNEANPVPPRVSPEIGDRVFARAPDRQNRVRREGGRREAGAQAGGQNPMAFWYRGRFPVRMPVTLGLFS